MKGCYVPCLFLHGSAQPVSGADHMQQEGSLAQVTLSRLLRNKSRGSLGCYSREKWGLALILHSEAINSFDAALALFMFHIVRFYGSGLNRGVALILQRLARGENVKCERRDQR